MDIFLSSLKKPDIIVAKPIPFGNYYLFPKHYIEYRVEYFEDLCRVCIVDNVVEYAKNIEDLDKNLHEGLIFMWQYYAKDEDDDYTSILTEDGKKIKYYMLANFMEIKQ